ncbi:MAG: hypothetical protein AAF648_13290 [Pseudomonadota bacterium]
MLCSVVLQALIPAGLMPSALSTGWYLQWCPDGMSPQAMAALFGPGHAHGHRISNPKVIAPAPNARAVHKRPLHHAAVAVDHATHADHRELGHPAVVDNTADHRSSEHSETVVLQCDFAAAGFDERSEAEPLSLDTLVAAADRVVPAPALVPRHRHVRPLPRGPPHASRIEPTV